MSRGGSSGGGQSSLGYLFGSDNETPTNLPSAAPKPTPPYGIDSTDDDKSDQKPKISNNNNYHRAQGQNSGNFITDRPTTKVKSAPGGGSSLGYLFGDK
ncbi:Protein SPIRAL1-like 5 [Hirschfeldia incana]|nr:Protein SPIRAL1-like 5 [Hirschfeldia incana]